VTAREQEVAAEIRRMVRDDLRIPEPFADGEELAGRLDSLLLLALATAVEDRFRIRLAEEDLAGTRSLGDLARLVAARAPQGGAGPEVGP